MICLLQSWINHSFHPSRVQICKEHVHVCTLQARVELLLSNLSQTIIKKKY